MKIIYWIRREGSALGNIKISSENIYGRKTLGGHRRFDLHMKIAFACRSRLKASRHWRYSSNSGEHGLTPYFIMNQILHYQLVAL
jgi:hypothetical protein